MNRLCQSLLRFAAIALVCAGPIASAGDSGCYPLHEISSSSLGDNAYNLVVKDQYVIIGIEHEDVLVYDMSNPASPQLVTSIDTRGRIYLDGDILYATRNNLPTGVEVFDVSDPANPVFLTEMDPSLTGDVIGIAFANGMTHLVSFPDNTLLTYDMSSPGSPQFVSSLTGIPYGGRYLYADGNDLYIGGGGFSIIDVSDPSSPAFVGGLPGVIAGEAVSVRVVGDVAYMAGEGSGFSAVDVSDTSNPVMLESGFFLYQIGLNDVARDIEVHGDLAYVGQTSEDFDGSDVFYHFEFGVVDISDPSSFQVLDYVTIGQALHPSAIHYEPDMVYLAGSSDLMVIDVSSTCGCPADLTGDGSLDFFDVSAFLNAFAAEDSIADLTGDGAFNFFDVSAFLNAFGAGCP